MTSQASTVPALPQGFDYSAMIRDLFKQESFKREFDAVLHAGIGIMGEVVELIDFTDRANLVEEGGDAMFYLEAAEQSISALFPQFADLYAFQLATDFTMVEGDAMRNMVVAAADFLDLCKKLWVYGKPLDMEMAAKMAIALTAIQHNMARIMVRYNISPDELIAANAWKLVLKPDARYKTGKYSDKAAQARADKAGVQTEIPFEFKKPEDTEGGTHD